MPNNRDKKAPPSAAESKANAFHWEQKPEPRATPRDRRWLAVSVAALVAWMAVLIWLAYR